MKSSPNSSPKEFNHQCLMNRSFPKSRNSSKSSEGTKLSIYIASVPSNQGANIEQPKTDAQKTAPGVDNMDVTNAEKGFQIWVDEMMIVIHGKSYKPSAGLGLCPMVNKIDGNKWTCYN